MQKKKKQSPYGKALLTGKHIALALLSMWLFVLALQLIKNGLQGLEHGKVAIDNIQHFLNSPLRSFSIGWLGTCLILSGSPIAAVGITLFSSGIQTDPTSLGFLIFGARGGPDLILFIIGVVTLLKGRTVPQSFTLGLLEFLTTSSIIFGSMIIYRLFFSNEMWGAGVIGAVGSFEGYTSVIKVSVDPVVETIIAIMHPFFVMFMGLGVLGCAIVLFDKFFSFLNISPEDQDPEKHHPLIRWWFKLRFRWKMLHSGRILQWMHAYLKLPAMAFLLGALVTGVTMSTAISVAIVIPFFAYGLISQRSAIAYVMAANITTFVDTFFLGVITHNPAVVSVILGVVSSVAICVLIYLALFKYYTALLKWIAAWVVAHPARLIAFVAITTIIPLPMLLT